ncbi:right-handed parallel beta-helix repeat-containing protein [Histidinibacterium aquaticum]|uniref:Right-handed parallel beta-helix repeat-containing protein n=2 Tax=Histidinibacterium aquaticum TaxID=2613962 RepID=A0A5J5GQP1_9RHOB|nr:right-handed parallel beta-helix repeat-containing protein [Histidinibacterium aquaticum]
MPGPARAEPGQNSYDVTRWPGGDASEDIGAVINAIIADIKTRQQARDAGDGGKPGGVIFIPPGDYRLRTQVVIDISYLRIVGAGHGFTSSSIRFNTPPEELSNWHEIWPGGSRIVVDLAAREEAAFLVRREGNPRISSVEFADFCIDGLHFEARETGGADAENSYLNGKTGIHVVSANDSFRITGMGLIYLEHGLKIDDADALSVDNNFIAECGNCIELRGMGQASRIANNLIGAGYRGHSIYAENHGGLLISGNNVFPRGKSSVHLSGVVRSSVTSNRFHSFYPGMLVLSDGASENLVSANHFLRDREPWAPMLGYDNGLDDLFGLVRIEGSNNSIIANHISQSLPPEAITPDGATSIAIRVATGAGNYIANNNVVGTVAGSSSDEAPNSACFATQVGALLSAGDAAPLDMRTVLIDEASAGNTVLFSGSDAEVEMDRSRNAFFATPVPAAGVTP